MKKTSRILALLLVAFLLIPSFAGCKGGGDVEETTGSQGGDANEADLDAVSGKTAPEPTLPSYSGSDTLVVGYDTFSEKFSPFFSKTAYDADVAGMTQAGLLSSDRTGNIILKGIEGETVSYNGTDYTYYGIADCTVTQNDDGTVIYEFTLRKDVYFSDGVNLTADDVLFSMYVLSDPTYDGSSTFYTLPIAGMEAYRSGMSPLSDLILAAGPDGTSEFFTAAQADAYWKAFDEAGLAFAQEIVDYCLTDYISYADAGYAGKYTGAEVSANAALGIAFGMRMWGFGSWVKDADGNFTGELKDADGTVYDFVTTFPTVEAYWGMILGAYGYDISDEGINLETAGTSIADFISAKLGDKAGEYAAAVKTGESADSISGIEKTSMYSLKITMTEFDATAIYKLSLSVSPLHYYGSRAAFKYSENKFGFIKGNLAGVKAKTTAPMGAGQYKFLSYKDGVVSFVRNTFYYKGCPIIANLKFQETSASEKLAGLVSGQYDITDPSSTGPIIDAIKKANSNGELTGNTVTYNAVDNLGYGYIGINANNVKVGNDAVSAASKNVRKALATVFAIYRDTVVKSYYGDRAAVIQYPISNTSWAAPQAAEEDYRLAYSTGIDGKALYTDSMTQADREAAALNAAIAYLKAAGYTWDEATKKFTAAPQGAFLAYEFIIPAGGTGDHPAYGIVTSAKDALAGIGITLNINDPSDSNVLWDSLEAGTCAMWAAAWGATPDPDMYQVYYSTNAVGLGGTDSNHYAIADATLDSLIMEARKSSDNAFRKATYKECLEIILDWAVEIPTYQRQNMVVFSTARVKVATVTPDITPFWGWASEIETLEMN